MYFEDEDQIPYKFFVCINFLIYEHDNFITALNALFISYFTFDFSYPPECLNIFTFLQHFYYQIFLERDVNSVNILSLIADLDADIASLCEEKQIKNVQKSRRATRKN